MIGATRTSTKVMFWICVVVVLAIIGVSVYCGIKIGGYKSELIGSERETRILTSQLTTVRAEVEESKAVVILIEGSRDRIRNERDTLVQQFGIIRQSIAGFEYSSEQGDDIIAASIRLIGEVIEIVNYLEGIGLFHIY